MNKSQAHHPAKYDKAVHAHDRRSGASLRKRRFGTQLVLSTGIDDDQ